MTNVTASGAGFYDKDLVYTCWYDLEMVDGGLYDEEFIDPVAVAVSRMFLPLLGVS